MNKRILLAAALLVAALVLPKIAQSDNTPSVSPTMSVTPTTSITSTMTFSDGSVAIAYDFCGDTDLCATIKYVNGEVLSIYSEGAAFCQPYLLNFVLANGPTTIYEYARTMNHDAINTSGLGTRCGHSLATQMVLDHGLVHMTVTENTNGTLKLVFSQ